MSRMNVFRYIWFFFVSFSSKCALLTPAHTLTNSHPQCLLRFPVLRCTSCFVPRRDVTSRVNGSFSNTGQRDALWGKSDLPSSTHTCSHTCLAPRLASGAVIDGRDGDAIPSTNKWKRESRHIDWIRFISVHSLVRTGVLGLFLLFGVSPLRFFSTPDRYERFTIERFSANDSKVGFLYVYWKNHEPFAGPGALNDRLYQETVRLLDTSALSCLLYGRKAFTVRYDYSRGTE